MTELSGPTRVIGLAWYVNYLLTSVNYLITPDSVIRSFRHKGLKDLFFKGRSAKVRHDLQRRCLRRLDALDAVGELNELNIPGFDFHGLSGRPSRYSIHVNGPFCITFEWLEGNAWRVDLAGY